MNRSSFAFVLMCLLGPATGAALAQGRCPSGTVEVARKEDAKAVYLFCGSPEDRDNYRKNAKRIEEVDLALPKVNAEVQRQAKLPDLAERYEEWIEMDKEARSEMNIRAANMLAAVALAYAGERIEKGLPVAEQELQALWDTYQRGPLNSPQFQRLSTLLGEGALQVERWRNAPELRKWLETTHRAIELGTDLHAHEYAVALFKIGLMLSGPAGGVAAAETEFVATLLVAGATDFAARKQIDTLLSLDTGRLDAINKLAKKSKDLVDERNRLRNENDLILARSRFQAPRE